MANGKGRASSTRGWQDECHQPPPLLTKSRRNRLCSDVGLTLMSCRMVGSQPRGRGGEHLML